MYFHGPNACSGNLCCTTLHYNVLQYTLELYDVISYTVIYLNTQSINCTPIQLLFQNPIYSSQTSQIQFLEEASTGQCVQKQFPRDL